MPKIGLMSKINAASKLDAVNTEGYIRMQLDPRQIIPARENNYSMEGIEELADNMLAAGQLQELIVGKVNGEYRLIVGHRRRLAGILNIERGYEEFEKMECKAKEMSEAMFNVILHSANIYNRTLTDQELTQGVRELKKWLEEARKAGEVKITGRTRDYIAKATGKSTGKIAQVESINNNLCEEGREKFEKGEINFTSAYEASRLPEEKQKEVLRSQDLLSKEIKQLVKEEQQKQAEELKKIAEAAGGRAEKAAKKAEAAQIGAAQAAVQAERAAETAGEQEPKSEVVRSGSAEGQEEIGMNQPEGIEDEVVFTLQGLLMLAEYVKYNEWMVLQDIHNKCKKREKNVSESDTQIIKGGSEVKGNESI